ncbi:Na+-transporting NADH:ubiquinone oxidoreductase subunit B [Nitrosomonas cryotolerans]|uniref:Na(+)-translocating NADH-quinone reductase subunit B n=1 Tax=Nitrosomonas cryotolerans ATCC 49181 TaxID=1131553 RepID=A0A1N6JJH5_9PROT|nr:NADH:ubiquinone reductase (Na(+)-transporting) subunit B [Nitrosomonas cryotolerans]SFQ03845.1 Na+-transporting NADH:ubiquinone oxidoreductase subunit B [Nitrosomonas cryotolerans]SIO44393.1 Na+-transporting NADH:ubiquinone oxidoreductase subunit B [Nitrosomonas cryotolerans ATCC 49181]
MLGIQRFLERIRPTFTKGGRLEKYHALYEMIDTFLYTSPIPTRSAPHVRDGVDLKRLMSYVVIALVPCILWSWFNTGYQANLALFELGTTPTDWRATLLYTLDIGFSPDSILANMAYGFLYFLPIYFITLIAGGFWEVLFAIIRKHEVNEGFLVTSLLYALTLPPDMPLWMVALGISFGIVVGKEIFGGTGKNFLNPALVGRAFLYFAYPADISGDQVWVAIDGYSAATPLSLGVIGGMEAISANGYNWWNAFIGLMPGSLGETSTLACLIGAAFLIYTKVASWRIIVGVFLGMIGTTLLFNIVGSDTNLMAAMPWHWHFVLGGFAFGMVFMATDPVSAAMTTAGRWIFGILIGCMTILIRVSNPAFPEGIMLAILFANIFAPLIDYAVMQINIRRRLKRHGQI